MRFSQRKRLTPVKVDIQKSSMDDALRNKLWSAVKIYFFDYAIRYHVQHSHFGTIIQKLWIHFFKLPLDTVPLDWDEIYNRLRDWFFKYKWYEVYDFIEALAKELEGDLKQNFINMTNAFLEQEMSAYRFVGDDIGELTNEAEIAAIEEAIKNTEELSPTHTHLREALSKLTDRKRPDYRNSIKESISAVEAMCKTITKNNKASLGDALKSLRDAGIYLHPSLEKAWSSLYGFTSDHGGIRHALSDSEKLGFAEAKYMLVSCSAFINYLLDLWRRS